jgi:endonuclease III
MAEPTRAEIVEAVLERHGQTYAHELGIDLGGGGPSALFRMLVASILFSARIGAQQAVTAARALADQGWTTAEKMAATPWERRVRVLNQHGYARYDERTATMLGDACALLLDRYGGDLRQLRDEAGRDPGRERGLLKQVKGIGDVGVDIFFREVQVAWEELYPFADARALDAAKQLGLGGDVAKLADGRDHERFTRLVAGLVRVRLARDYDEVLAAAGG